jgi:hypothetical protein
MRSFVFALLVLSATAAIGTPAEAANYPWCAYYGATIGGGGTNCGFTSFQQCLATVSGIGGYCAENTQYQPPAAVHRTRKHTVQQ